MFRLNVVRFLSRCLTPFKMKTIGQWLQDMGLWVFLTAFWLE